MFSRTQNKFLFPGLVLSKGIVPAPLLEIGFNRLFRDVHVDLPRSVLAFAYTLLAELVTQLFWEPLLPSVFPWVSATSFRSGRKGTMVAVTARPTIVILGCKLTHLPSN